MLEIQRHLNGIKQCMCAKGHDMILSRGLPLKLNGLRYRAVHCDGCKTRNIDNQNDFYHCTLCSFDYCIDCAKSQNVTYLTVGWWEHSTPPSYHDVTKSVITVSPRYYKNRKINIAVNT